MEIIGKVKVGVEGAYPLFALVPDCGRFGCIRIVDSFPPLGFYRHLFYFFFKFLFGDDAPLKHFPAHSFPDLVCEDRVLSQLDIDVDCGSGGPQ